MNSEIIVVGAGQIAVEYVKVLIALGFKPTIVTRGEAKAQQLVQIFGNVRIETGGLEKYLQNNLSPTFAVLATQIDYLPLCTEQLIMAGCKNVLVEKPLTFSYSLAVTLTELAKARGCTVGIAYNRRGFTSVAKALELIELDGGVRSVHFDFTEAIFRIDFNEYSADTLQYLGLANSSHLIDIACYFMGQPKWMESRHFSEELKWHPTGGIFIGMGESENGIPFTYHSNWLAPGRWNLEVMTSARKLFFSPMEILREQRLGSFAVNPVEADYKLDEEYKPGFYVQVASFLKGTPLFRVDELPNQIQILNQIFKYNRI